MHGSGIAYIVLSAIALTASQIALVWAANVLDPVLSLGTPITQDKSNIPEWSKLGSVLVEMDRVFLTAPGEQGQSGAIWTEKPNPYTSWESEISFRASGGERPGGGLAIWYTSQKEEGSIYGSRDFWDGLAIIIDSTGGQGTVRGHLNDGTIGYNSLPDAQSQAFAQCSLRYRNTGSLINIKITASPSLLKVEVDGRPCFTTDQVVLPTNYYLGISAASYDNPDSFEIFSFKTSGSDPVRENAPPVQIRQRTPRQPNQPQATKINVPEARASSDNSPQMRELTNQITALHKVVDENFAKVLSLREEIESLHAMKPLLERLDLRLGRVESLVTRTEAQFHGAAANMHESTKQNVADEINKLTDKLDLLDRVLKEHTTSLADTLPNTISEAITKGGPSIWLAFSLLILIQAGLIAGYIIYKKRRGDFHPKFL
ncbi:concanavalin A-like lectin/glucanase domain-containing protein [Lipomyces arxii]|uniref:concanavalin A-like lectin/glucanase domain-containing protein n=1 Tax=Lipomyces arxii TaxID=56418 RepID=UPI0034CD4E89